jgi:NitT/TauT family transport system substrate-binding protein
MKKTIVFAALIAAVIGSLATAVVMRETAIVTVTPGAEPLRIAVQYGLGYAPLTIADELGLFEKYTGASVEWKQYGSGGAIREALVAGELDAGFMGIPPFIIGWDKGAPWKVATALCVMPLGLQTNREDRPNLSAFEAGDKVAYPSPGSIQHILLSMASEKELGDATALDDLGVAMKHPDGAAALLADTGDITAHFTSPPYIFKELEDKGIWQVVSGADAFGGDFTFIVGVATTDFHDSRSQAYAGFVAAIAEAVAFINEHPKEAAAILAPTFKLDEATTLKYMTWPGVNYTTTPYGLMGFAPFMEEAGYIEKVPERLSDLAWPNVVASVGQKQGERSAIETLQERP